jgi:hypothetical protein
MVSGLRNGIARPHRAGKNPTYERAAEFMARFRARHGAVRCRELLGHDFATPEGRAAIQERKLTRAICPALVTSAVEILQEMLAA